MKVFHRKGLIFERGEPMLDQTDMNILKELSKNSRLTMKALGEKVHLTGQAVANRVLKLEEEGVIEAYTISIDWQTQKTIQTFCSCIPVIIIMNHFCRFFIKGKKSRICTK